VDCHVNKPDFNFDARLSTMMTEWFKNVGSEVLNKAQAAAPEGVTLKGVHPQASESMEEHPGRLYSLSQSQGCIRSVI
jgi:hypothetical protein